MKKLLIWMMNDLAAGRKVFSQKPPFGSTPGKVPPKAAPYRNRFPSPYVTEIPRQPTIEELYERYVALSNRKLAKRIWTKNRLDS